MTGWACSLRAISEPVTLQLHSFFHLNLAYSAIEEEDRPPVIARCYWPLLRLARRRGLPFGIELSGYTLETIAAIDPEWVAELRALVSEGPCELIGCGYAQIIGPLVPPEVTAANLRIGHQVYERLLGCRPMIALLNEQAYSAGLVPLYQAAGYQAIIMEWNNPARAHPEWDPEWRYLPQLACGPEGERMPLIWNKSITFQKFQRYVHGELELDELLAYVRGHRTNRTRALPLYGNDVEIFDFRPGRYMTEAPLHDEGEWARIDRLYAALQAEPGMSLIPPSQVLGLMGQPGAGQPLRLESAAQPTPVKKQDKYNLVRWAVTGRDDLGINTKCWQLFAALRSAAAATDADWRELCYLWSSDFRTHITEARWQRYRRRLERVTDQWLGSISSPYPLDGGRPLSDTEPGPMQGAPCDQLHWQSPVNQGGGKRNPAPLQVIRQGRLLDIRGERLWVRFNCLRGLALDAFTDFSVSERPLCGTLLHGYFDDIRWGADYYSGHLVFESPGHPKITDLSAVEPELTPVDGGLQVSGVIPTPLGPVAKRWWLDEAHGRLTLSLRLHWPEPLLGALRLGHLTLIPGAFDPASLGYRTHNGGMAMETFNLAETTVSHGRAVSFLVSANEAVGLTGGVILIGDARRWLRLRCDKTQAALIGLVTHQPVGDSHFTRLSLSVRELDDTSRPAPIGPLALDVVLNASVHVQDIAGY